VAFQQFRTVAARPINMTAGDVEGRERGRPDRGDALSKASA